MELTSGTALVVVAVLALGLPVVAVLTWPRVKGPRPARVGQRLGMVALAQVCAVLVAFMGVNDHYLFFTSWQDLLGSPPPVGQITATGGSTFSGPHGRVAVFRGTSRTTPDGGRLITEMVHGSRSGVTAPVLVHLPAGYDSSKRSYPVVELLIGWRGGPSLWVSSFQVLQVMAAQQAAGAFGPVITVMPTVNVAVPRDAECTDIPHGIQAETWLTTDMRDLVLSQYRALSVPRSWGLMGYSSGGYCAAKMLLHRPAWYGAAVSMSGYFEAVRDSTTGDLWGGSRARREENSPLWLVTHRPVPPVDLLVFASRQDTDSYRSTERFLRAAHAPLQTFSLVVPRGGHNLKALSKALPEMLDWLAGHLAVEAHTSPKLA